jgi:hypothetical protein
MASLEASIKECSATIEIAEMPTLVIDESLIATLFRHLVANALKFSRCPPEVSITAERIDAAWVLGVKDRGPGIDPQYAYFAPSNTSDLKGMTAAQEWDLQSAGRSSSVTAERSGSSPHRVAEHTSDFSLAVTSYYRLDILLDADAGSDHDSSTPQDGTSRTPTQES